MVEATQEKGTEQKQEVVEKERFEIPQKNTKVEPSRMTIIQAQDKGWSNEEIDIAKKEGMLVEQTDEVKTEEVKKVEEPKADTDKTKIESKVEPREDQHIEDFILTPEEEKNLAEAIKNPSTSKRLRNVAAQYFGRKAAISRAQSAEAERNRVMQENKELKERLMKIEQKIDNGNQDIESEEDEKPLTPKALREMIAKMNDEAQKKQNEQKEMSESQQRKINESLQIQENHAKNSYPDYLTMVDLANKLVARDANGAFLNEVNITTLPETARKKALALLRSIRSTAVRADEMTVEDYTVADMTYDLGKLAKEYMPESHQNGTQAERPNGGLTPEEEEERIRKNKSRPGSSASVSGNGGRRSVTVDDVTIEDLNAMDSKTFDAFQKKHPDKVEELMRG